MKTKKKKIGLITLGCDKNRVDSEFILTKLANDFTFSNDVLSIDVLIINTCSFIKQSKEESYNTINEFIEYKKKNKKLKIVICGCMVESDFDTLQSMIDVDGFIGINHYDNILEYVKCIINGERIIKLKGDSKVYFEKDRKITTLSNYAYLKIADGCDNFCTFCRIPYIRGRYRSQKMDLLIEEAKSLVEFGASELILVAQDITKYGIDFDKKQHLVELIQELSKIDNLRWIRLLYAYPENIDDELINEIKTNPKVCKYIDIPMQHVSNRVLKKMNRKSNYDSLCKLIEKLKEANICIRSTFMVGFPEESDDDFQLLCDFIKKYALDNVGFFKFSKEKNTVADRFEETVSEEEKEKRLEKISKQQKSISRKNLKKYLGKTLNVVVEGVNDDNTMFVGRTEFQTPDVDGITYFISDKELKIGDYVNVKITKTKDYDIQGETI